MALIYQHQGQWSQARDILAAGLEHYTASPDLNICMAGLLLHDHQAQAALEHLLPFESHPQAQPLIARCYQISGDLQQAARYKTRNVRP